jgi:translation initiation factor 1
VPTDPSHRDPDGAPDARKGLTHNPFAALRASTPKDASSPAPERAAEPPPPAPAAPTPAATLVVRREKKGRGGKTVTRVSGLAPDASALADLARDMKRALGCGATVDGADILLQGALTERASAWLRERLGARVTLGN